MRHAQKTLQFLVALSLLVAAPLCLAGGKKQSAAHAKPVAQAEEGPPNKAIGSRNAPIVMEVFSDYSCPACKAFYMSAIRPMLDEYVATGKVYLIHRDYPLKGVTGHEHSREAALYANAAGEIGKFQEVDAALYEKQEVWSCNQGRNSRGAPCTQDVTVETTVASVLTPSEMKHVRKLVEGGKLDAFIDSDQALGGQKGVRQTPSIYVTSRGTTYPLPAGGVSYNLLKKFLDDQLRH